jgi:phosphoglycerate dehydrogenase-like enzyme/tRNA A-37 threonylcarbamoyl transferase component Bud32
VAGATPGQVKRAVLTDHPWADLDIEQSIFGAAGIELIAGPVEAPDAAAVEAMAQSSQPSAILTCWATVSAAAIEAAAPLRIVARLGIGLDNIAVSAATTRGAWVTNVPDYCIGEVSDHAIALMLAHFRGIPGLERAAKKGVWDPTSAQPSRIADLTVGIIGYGRIGRETARKLAPFGCRILAHAPRLSQSEAPVEAASLNDIRRQCEVIFLHAPLTDSTRGLINFDFLQSCAQRPLIVNVSRGGLVDNGALLQALDDDLIRGAALDVVEGEPTPPQAMLLDERVIVTPHISFLSGASLVELRTRACEEVVRVLNGERPLHPCNKPFAPGEQLAGGVASDIRVVETPEGPQVVKRALSKLRVAADWRADPARSDIEVAALQAAAKLIGADAVPKVLWTDPERHCFGMELIKPQFRNWKDRLLAGDAPVPDSKRAGALLAQLHHRSRSSPDLAKTFASTANFEELRIDPFFTRPAQLAGPLGPAILAAADGMRTRRDALVHGDYSPKNLLTDGEHIVVLDWEVAHWGDPRFDIAFCTSHLLLKAFRSGADRSALLHAAAAFGAAYRAGNPGYWDQALTALVGALLVARIIGSSPVDYLGSVEVDSVMQWAGDMLLSQQPLNPHFTSRPETAS